MRAIFISYRRDDSEGEAGRLFDDLVAQFGEDSVFMDVAAIEAGRDFRKAIDESVATCGVLLAVIGKEWIDAKNQAGQRRLDDTSDFVRLETASALKRDIPVIPVLVRGAKMPSADQLPDDLKDLAYRNGVELTHARWSSDLQLLIKALRPHVGEPKNVTSEPSTPLGKAAAAAKSDDIASSRLEFQVSSSPAMKPLGKILAVVAAVLVVGGVVAYMFMPGKVTVPDLSGNTLADATAKLEALHLTVGRRKFQPDATRDPNTVLSQSPAPNEQVKSGTKVDLVLSQQAAMVEIPPLIGKRLDAARQALEDRHLTVGKVSREPRPGVAPNTVLDEFPEPGKKAEPGTAVDLVVADASGASSGQSPGSGQRVQPGSKVDLTVAGRPRCLQGYVWREASPNDDVCVTPAVHNETLNDNAQAAERRRGSGTYGPDSCKRGYVWRDAFPNDHVCVPPATRSQAAADNAAAKSRIVPSQ